MPDCSPPLVAGPHCLQSDWLFALILSLPFLLLFSLSVILSLSLSLGQRFSNSSGTLVIMQTLGHPQRLEIGGYSMEACGSDMRLGSLAGPHIRKNLGPETEDLGHHWPSLSLHRELYGILGC